MKKNDFLYSFITHNFMYKQGWKIKSFDIYLAH